MNGKPEKWCGRCGGTGMTPQKAPCPCLKRTSPIAKPVKCPGGCGVKLSPNPDGSFNLHGSLGWSCNGKIKRDTRAT